MRLQNKLWAIFGLFIWLHILPSAFNPQWEDASGHHKDEVFSFSPNAYSDQDFASGLTVIEFEEEYIASATAIWLFTSILSVLGIYSSWLIYKNSKYWSLLVLCVTVAACLKVVPDTITAINLSQSPLDHYATGGRIFIKYIREGESLDRFLVLSLLYLWPVYLVILLCYSGFDLICKSVKRASVA